MQRRQQKKIGKMKIIGYLTLTPPDWDSLASSLETVAAPCHRGGVNGAYDEHIEHPSAEWSIRPPDRAYDFHIEHMTFI